MLYKGNPMKFIISRKFVSEIIQPTNDDDVAHWLKIHDNQTNKSYTLI